MIVQDIQCYGDKGTLEAVVQPAGNYNYSWNTTPAQTSAIATGLSGGTYTVQVSGNQACSITDQVTLVEPNEIISFLGNDTVICSGNTMRLDAGDFASYVWQDGSANRFFSVTKSGNYSVTVTDNNGCADSDTIRVTVDCSDIYFPEAFTPDGNGRNESFGAIGNTAAVGNYLLRIYNRWGQLIFQSNDPNRKWDGTVHGKRSGSQSFVWFASYTLTATQIKKQQKGTITVIR
jgi:gliding motility-associated-like protein